MHYVYIIICADGTYYVGHTNDPKARLKDHCGGRGSRYTADHGPVRLVHVESLDSLESAVRREKQLKGWSHEKKDALVRGDLERLKRLAKCRRMTKRAQ